MSAKKLVTDAVKDARSYLRLAAKTTDPETRDEELAHANQAIDIALKASTLVVFDPED